MKKLLVILGVIGLMLFLLPTAAVFTVRHPKVQKYLVDEATKMLSGKLKTKVSVGAVRFRLFNRLVLHDVYVQGLSGDTLIFANRVMGSLTRLSPSDRHVEVGTLRLTDARLYLEKDTAGVLNLGLLLSRLKDTTVNPTPKEPTEKPFHIRVQSVEADQLSFSYVDRCRQGDARDSAIDFKHLLVSDVSFRVSNLNMEGDTMQCRLRYLQLRERSGFHLQHLSGEVSVAPTFIEVKKLKLRDDFSDINAKYYRMDYSSFSDFTRYVEKVTMSADFTSSNVDLYTIAFFAPNMSKLHLNVGLTGLVSGQVCNLRGRDLMLRFGKGTAAKVSFSMQGLPDPQNTFFMFDVKNFESNPEDVFTADAALKSKYAKHRALLQQLGSLQGKARFTGFLSNFVADGVLRSDIGTLTGDLSFVPAPDSAILINGTLGTDNFHLGTLLNDSIMGEISLYGKVSGTFRSIKSLSLNADLNIPMVELYGYPYRNTKVKGLITEKSFEGELVCSDANMSFGFSGIANFEQEKSQFDFKLQVHHADFAATGLNRRDSLSQLTLEAVAKLEGNSIDNFSGNLTINSAKYTSTKGEFPADSILLEARHTGDTERLSLKSDVLEASITAKGGMENIVQALDSMVSYFIPTYRNLIHAEKTAEAGEAKAKAAPHSKAPLHPKFEYTFSALTKNAEKLQQLLIPSFTIADSTQVSGCISSDISCVKLSVNAPAIRYGELSIANVRLNAASQSSQLRFSANAAEATSGNLKLQRCTMVGTLQNDLLALTLGYKTSIASGQVKTQVAFFEDAHGKRGLDVELFPTILALGDMPWSLSKSKIRIEDRRYTIDSFKVENERQLLCINGVISPDVRDTLLCEVRNLSVAPLIRTLNNSVELTGDVSGSISARGVLAPMPLFSANVKASDVTFAQKPVGDVTFHTSIAENEEDVSVHLNISKGGEENLSVSGTLKGDGELTAQAKLNKLDLYHVSPIVESTLSDLGGTLSGDLDITGPLKQLQLNGELFMSHGQLTVDYLNARFKVSGPVEMANSTLKIRNMTATDDANNAGSVDFTLANLTTPDKFYYSLKVTPNKLHVFNTTERHNDYFYGQGYATGTVQIDGRRGETSISATATTNEKTAFSILLGPKAQMQSRSFIDFVAHDKKVEVKKDEEATRKFNLKVDLNLNVTNDANLTLLLNQQTGNAIKAAGNGNIKFEIEPAKNVFRLFGTYVMLRGEYAISVQNLVTKKFKIDNGSSINFNGELAAATANVHATYKLRAPLSDLLGDTTGRYERAIPIECKVSMTGSLAAPELNLSIDAPTADNETKDRMLAQLNMENNMTTQFLSLLLIDRFMPQQDVTSSEQSSILSNVMFAQVSDIFSRAMNANVGVSIDLANTEEYSLSFNKGFFTDRVTLNANVDHQSQRKQLNPNSSEFATEVDLEVTLDKSGKVRVKMFGHSNDQYTEMVAGSNRYGVGVFYQEDFDSFTDLWRAMFHSRKNAKKAGKTVVTSQDSRQETSALPDSNRERQ